MNRIDLCNPMNAESSPTTADSPQNILVFQQNGSGETKIAGVRRYGGSHIALTEISIDTPLPPIIEDSSEYLPHRIEADLVLDFLRHPDLSYDLAELCSRQKIPLIASGKKRGGKGIHTPPT